jgi:hypothetical protein
MGFVLTIKIEKARPRMLHNGGANSSWFSNMTYQVCYFSLFGLHFTLWVPEMVYTEVNH